MNSQNQTENLEIKDNSSIHKCRTELPNIIYNMNLTPNEGWFYNILKKIAGDNGKCFYSNKKLAQLSNMCEKTIRKLKIVLEKRNLIKIEKRIKQDLSKDTDLITIVDLWPENFKKFYGGGVVTDTDRLGKNGQGGAVPDTDKEDPIIKKEPIKKDVESEDVDISPKDYKNLEIIKELNNHLFQKIKQSDPKFEIKSKNKWLKDMNGLVNIDKREKEVIKEMINYAHQEGNFWKSNILSPGNLREQFTRLINESKSNQLNQRIDFNKMLLKMLKKDLFKEKNKILDELQTHFDCIYYPRKNLKISFNLPASEFVNKLNENFSRKIQLDEDEIKKYG